MVMACEGAFEVDLPDLDEFTFGGPGELVNWLEAQLSNRRPNKVARTLLKKLAEDKGRPELAEGLDGPWKREQIAAIVREIFR
jgi:hypothetical protein